VGLLAGTLLGTTVGWLAGTWLGEGHNLPLYLGTLLGLSAGALAGAVLGLAWWRRLPVRFRRYNAARGTVSVRFDNPAIAARVIAALREQAEAALARPVEDSAGD
jgi:hypothetical protein